MFGRRFDNNFSDTFNENLRKIKKNSLLQR